MEIETSETAILSRALNAANGSLSPEAAQSILDLSLSDTDKSRLAELSNGAGEGSLSPEQETEIENLRHAARVLELFKSKARLALKASSENA